MKRKKPDTNISIKNTLIWCNNRDKVFGNGSRYSVVISKDIKTYKNFCGLKNHDDLLELTDENLHLYEVATTNQNKNVEIRKLYVDVDCFKDDPITEDKLKTIINGFLVKVNTEIKDNNIEITYDDIVVLLNDDFKKNGVKSFHFIVKNYCMDFLQQKQLIKNMNATNDTDCDYDETIYSRNQQFRMINQSKINKTSTLISYKPLNHIKDTFITDTKKCVRLNYDRTLTQTIKDDNSKNDKTEIHLTKKTFNLIIDNVEKLWNSSSNWKQSTRIIKKYGLFEMKEWNKLSIQKASRNYDEEKNNDFINGIDIDLVKSGIPTLLNILNKCSINNYFTMEYDKYEREKTILIDYLETNNYEIVVNDMVEFKSKPILANELYEIDLKNGFITDKRNNKRVNFYDKSDCSNDIFNTININHISEINTESYISCMENKLLPIKSDCGTGKSHHILKPIIKSVYETHSILIITPINSLNNKMYDDLKQYGFKSHLDIEDGEKLCDHNLVLCSIQSICKLENKKYDYVFLDEFECIMTNFTSDTFKQFKSSLDCYRCFLKKCEEADKLICLDADLNHNRLKLLTDAINYDTSNMNVYHNSQNEYADYNYILTDDKKKFLSDINEKLDDNKKIVISAGSANFGEVMFNNLQDEYPNKNICFIYKKGVFVWNGKKVEKHTDKHKDLYIQNLEYNLKKDEIDVWIYSPTISVGISINEELFDYGFAYGINCSINALQFYQQLFRARNIKDKEYKIYLGKMCWNAKKELNIEQTKYHFDLLLELFKSFNLEHNKQDFKVDENYLKMYQYAKMINENSRISYKNELIKLFNTHHLRYEYEKKEPNTLLNSSTFEDTKEQLEFMKQEEFYQREILSVSQYEDVKNKIENNDDIEDDVRESYYKTNSIYHLANIHNLMKEIGDESLEWNKDEIEKLVSSQIYKTINDDESGLLYEKCKALPQFLECRFTYNTLKKINDDDDLDDMVIEEHEINNLNKIENSKRTNFMNMVDAIKYNYNNKTITNNELYNIIENNKVIFKRMYDTERAKNEPDKDFDEWLNNYKNKKTQTEKDKKYCKKIYEVIKELFKIYDIQIKYNSTINTTRAFDKIHITPYNKIINYGNPKIKNRYIQELYTLAMKMKKIKFNSDFDDDLDKKIINVVDKKYYVNDIQVFKTRASRHNNENKYVDTYRPYKITLSSKLQKLKYRNKKQDDYKKQFKKVMIELKKTKMILNKRYKKQFKKVMIELKKTKMILNKYEPIQQLPHEKSYVKINKKTQSIKVGEQSEKIQDFIKEWYEEHILQELKIQSKIPKIQPLQDQHLIEFIQNIQQENQLFRNQLYTIDCDEDDDEELYDDIDEDERLMIQESEIKRLKLMEKIEELDYIDRTNRANKILNKICV